MSIESRLRDGLKANTAMPPADVDRDLGAVLRRARRRTGWRRAVVAGVVAAAGLVAAMRPDLDLTRVDTPAGQAPAGQGSGASRALHDGSLEPGRYRVEFAGSDGSIPLAVVEAPRGYEGDDGWAVSDRDPGVLGLGFSTVAEVVTEPCGTGIWLAEDPGPSVADLAEALVEQKLTRATRPTPVRVDGHDGLYLELRLPRTIDVESCPGGHVRVWSDESGGTRWISVPGELNRLWILDLDGHRVVIDAASGPDDPPARIAEVTRMVESLTFTDPGSG